MRAGRKAGKDTRTAADRAGRERVNRPDSHLCNYLKALKQKKEIYYIHIYIYIYIYIQSFARDL